jgi:hypothetical protein
MLTIDRKDSDLLNKRGSYLRLDINNREKITIPLNIYKRQLKTELDDT